MYFLKWELEIQCFPDMFEKKKIDFIFKNR